MEVAYPPKKKNRSIMNETISTDNTQQSSENHIRRSPRISTKDPFRENDSQSRKRHIDVLLENNKACNGSLYNNSLIKSPVRKSPRLQPRIILPENKDVCQRTSPKSKRTSYSPSSNIVSVQENDRLCVETSPSETVKSSNRITPSSTTASERKAERRKSKRRSSFVSGRISKPLSAAQSNKISQDVPANLSPDMRLEMLHRKTMEHSLSRLQQEFSDLPQYEAFKIQVLDCAESRVTDLRERGDFIKATTPYEKLLQSTENQRIEESIRLAEAQIKKYEEENQIWDKILEEHKQAADEAERLRVQLEENPAQMSGFPDNLSKQQKALLSARPNYSELIKNVQIIHNKQVLAMDAINIQIKRHANTFKHAQKAIEEQSKHIAGVSFPTLASTSPRRLIQDITKHHNTNNGGDKTVKEPESTLDETS